MTKSRLLEQAFVLTDEILKLRIDGNPDEVPYLEALQQIAFLYLGQSHETLSAIDIILRQNILGPAEILVRHLFELEVRLKYMAACPATVEDFLKHCHIGAEPSEEGWRLLDKGDFSGLAQKYLPKTWGNLKEMAERVGQLNDYLTVYKLTSERSHGGVREMPLEFQRLFDNTNPDWMKLRALQTALACYSQVLSINGRLFPHVESTLHKFESTNHWNARLIELSAELKTWVDGIIKARSHPTDMPSTKP